MLYLFWSCLLIDIWLRFWRKKMLIDWMRIITNSLPIHHSSVVPCFWHRNVLIANGIQVRVARSRPIAHLIQIKKNWQPRFYNLLFHSDVAHITTLMVIKCKTCLIQKKKGKCTKKERTYTISLLTFNLKQDSLLFAQWIIDWCILLTINYNCSSFGH